MLVSMRDLLLDAQHHRYGIGMFDIMNLENLNGVVAAAEKENSPVILATFPLLGNLESFSPAILYAIEKARVPIAYQMDHGDIDHCFRAIQHGCNALMYDGSMLPFQGNVENTCRVVQAASACGFAVEAELGHVANAEITFESDEGSDTQSVFTVPEEAQKFVELTGVDALAVSIGSLHGRYTSAPKLQFDLLQELKEAAGVPLVLHGGSGIPDADIRDAIECGITKINLCTEILDAGVQSLAAQEDLAGMGLIRAMEVATQAIEQAARKKIQLLGSNNRA